MTVDILRAPFPITYRELWLPRGIRENTTLPSSKYNGHGLTLTGAQKGTTSDGLHFNGTATSNVVVAAAAGQNAQQAFAITIRFKLDSTFAAGAAADQYLFQKLLAADDYLRVYLENADGKLYWQQGNLAGGVQFTLTSTTVSWTANTWYTITASLTSTPTQRLVVNGTVEDTDTAAAVATPNGGNMVIGSSSDGGVDGIIGTISWVVIGVGTTAATALTVAEETTLNKGFPPATAKVQYMFLMDEGRGVTTYDRGSAGGNGVIGTACTWAWGSCRQPVLSLDGINDRGVSSAGVDVSGAISLVWVGKMKSTYNILGANHTFIRCRGTNLNHCRLLYGSAPNALVWIYRGTAAEVQVDWPYHPGIDDYLVLIGTVNVGGVASFFANGTLIGSAAGADAALGGESVAYIGATHVPDAFDISKPLLVALAEGAFTDKQALAYSRWLDNILNMGIGI